jgi:hypothetical protein
LGLLLAAAVLVGVTGVALADSGGQPAREGHMFGIVPSLHSASRTSGSGNLSYHGGPVEHTNTVYAIYWVPSGYTVSSDYTTVINRFFGDVAADNGKTTNVYYAGTQYYDGSGNVTYASTFAGSTTDTNAYPPNGCSDSYTQVCLSDSQIQSEIQKVVAANHWPTGGSTEYFMFTAKGVGSCSGSSCAFSNYCAYHSWIGSGSSEILYANMPYADTVPSACDAGQHPNNSDADATINVTSHEHNETITDPNGNAWYDRRGYEDGDKCAWNFGTQLGSTAYGQYNQVINGHDYELQQEWSNATSSCVLQGT